MERTVEKIVKSLVAVAWMDGRMEEEEMGMIAAIESMIDEDTDRELASGYAMAG